METPTATAPAAETTEIAHYGSSALSQIDLPKEIEQEVRDLIRVTKLTDYQAMEVFESFRAGFEPFLAVRNEAMAIIVTDASQTELIGLAKSYDQILMEADQQLTAIHKVKKEEPLRISQMIDGSRRIPSNAIAKVRAHLKQQIDFAKIQRDKEIALVATARRERLAEYNAQDSIIVGLGTIEEEQFELILAGAKAKFEQDKHDAANAAAENERLRVENERLRREREEADRLAAEERRKAEYERMEKERVEAEARRIENERLAAERAEADRIEAEKAAEAAKVRAAELAPDKDKLFAYAMELQNVAAPTLSTDEANAILRQFNSKFTALLMDLGYSTHAAPATDKDCPF